MRLGIKDVIAIYFMETAPDEEVLTASPEQINAQHQVVDSIQDDMFEPKPSGRFNSWTGASMQKDDQELGRAMRAYLQGCTTWDAGHVCDVLLWLGYRNQSEGYEDFQASVHQLAQALDVFKDGNGVKFPLWSEVRAVALSCAWARVEERSDRPMPVRRPRIEDDTFEDVCEIEDAREMARAELYAKEEVVAGAA